MGKRGVYGIDIVGDTADDITRRVGIEIVDGQRSELFKKLTTHGIDDLLAEMDHQDRKQIGKHRRCRIANEHLANVFPNHVELHTALGGDRVDGFTRKVGTHQRELIGKQGQHDGGNEEPPIMKYVFAESRQDMSCRFGVEFFHGGVLVRIFRTGVFSEIAFIQRWHLPSGNH